MKRANESHQARGGRARAQNMTPQERTECASKAAKARWENENHTKQFNFRRSKEMVDNLLLLQEIIFRKTGIRPTTTAVLEMAVKNEAARWTSVGELEVPAPLQVKSVKP